MTRIMIASACLMFASAASATSPIAYSFATPPTARISTGDVDIGSAQGRTVVQHRINRAAEKVCIGSWGDSFAAQPMSRYSDCYTLAVKSGQSQLDQLAAK